MATCNKCQSKMRKRNDGSKQCGHCGMIRPKQEVGPFVQPFGPPKPSPAGPYVVGKIRPDPVQGVVQTKTN